MFALYKKEISSFLSSLIGYLVIFVFLVTISLFLWVFPGTEFNIFESGYATMDGLFMLAPWVFMFLVPAITMKMFSEEKKTGTLELLLTRPLTELGIILAKYLAGLTLVVLAVIPTLIYTATVYLLASPAGNIDSGAIAGSYCGLIFLAASYVAIGLFSSSVSESQITAFILALFLSFLFYLGFDSLSRLELFGPVDIFIQQLGMHVHFISMSRGVIDTRDLIYFLSVSAIFIWLTRLMIRRAVWQS